MSELRNAFSLAADPPVYIRLKGGLVPVGYRTLTEVGNDLIRTTLTAIDPASDAWPFEAVSVMLRELAGALAKGAAEAIVDFGVVNRLHRVPADWWEPAWDELTGTGLSTQSRFSVMMATGRLIGQEFGVCEGHSPCIETNQAATLVASLAARLTGDPTFVVLIGPSSPIIELRTFEPLLPEAFDMLRSDNARLTRKGLAKRLFELDASERRTEAGWIGWVRRKWPAIESLSRKIDPEQGG